MEEKNELNDIILNRNNGNAGMKKIMLAVAALAVLLIIVVVIMSSLNSGGTANLPQAIEPPKNVQANTAIDDDPLFEPMSIDEAPSQEESLDNVAKKIKAQSEKEEVQEEISSDFIAGPDEVIVEEPTEVVVPAKYERPVKKESKTTAPKKVSKKTPVKKTVSKKVQTKPKAVATGNYYVQVGSFGRFDPDKKFLKKITSHGYTYKIHKVNGLTKVLVGPYPSDAAARKQLPAIRSTIERGAFLSRI